MNGKITSLTLLTMLLLSVGIMFPVHSVSTNSMYIQPAALNFNTNTTPLGSKFNVTVWLDVASNVNSWQFYFIYNKALLTITNSGYTGNGKSLWSGADSTDNPPSSTGSHNATHDYMLYGEVLKASKERTGAGSLAWIELQTIKAPGSGETITSELRLDVVGIFSSGALDKNFNPIDPPLTFGKATYTYMWPWNPPPPATVYVDPAMIMNRSLTPSHNFTVDVKIAKASNVSEFEFKLNFNSTILNVVEVTLGGFFPPSVTPTIEIDNPNGYVRVNALLGPSDPEVSGNGTLATIKFHVEGLGLTALHLSDITLEDKKSHTLPYTSSDGYFTNTALLGDVNGDGKVDIQDVARASAAFGSYPGHPRWNPNADINKDGHINVFDMAVICSNFGQPR
jgi:hypothetical protein